MAGFNSNIALGGVMLGVYLLMGNVMLLNLLIALLSNVYSDLIVRVDSEHRAVVIAYYNRFQWDEKYGNLIFLPSPLSYFLFILSPIGLLHKNPKGWNSFLCKCMYIFYAIPQFAFFVVGSLLFLPLMYFKGFMSYGKTGVKKSG